jgi:hypothetical protein
MRGGSIGSIAPTTLSAEADRKGEIVGRRT